MNDFMLFYIFGFGALIGFVATSALSWLLRRAHFDALLEYVDYVPDRPASECEREN